MYRDAVMPGFTRPTLSAVGSWEPRLERGAWLLVRVVSSAALLMAIGVALSWDMRFLVGGALAIAAATWLTNSVARSIWCAFGAIGLLAAGAALIQALHASLFDTLHIEWRFVAWAWFAAIVLLALSFRRARQTDAHGVSELIACWVGIAAALAISLRLDFAQSLLPYLVHVEDNAAWVSLTTQVHSAVTLGPGFSGTGLGPVNPMLLGLLAELQTSSIPYFNAAFSAYAVAVILTPLVVAGLLGRLRHRGALVVAAFTAVAFGWAYHVPFLLFASFGHLSATLAFLFLVAGIAMLAVEDSTAIAAPVSGGIIFAAGATWFPLIPVALVGLGVVGWIAYRSGHGRRLVATIALVAALWLLLAFQAADLFGIGSGGSLAGAKAGLGAMYSSQGGTASLDSVLQVLVLAGLVGAAFISSPPVIVSRLWRCTAAIVAYVAVVFGGSYLMKFGLGYGPTKLWFVIGFAAATVLVIMIARLPIAPRAIGACLIALTMGAFVFGGMGELLARTWPGGGLHPVWLVPVTAVAAQDQASAPHSLTCFSNDTLATYLCTRWAAGLTTGRDKPFLDYRLQVINGVDPTKEIGALASGGALGRSDLIVLDLPDGAHLWGWTLIERAGRVFDASGKLLVPRPQPPVAP